MSLSCSTCGFNNPPGMRFCGNCGTRLAASTSNLVSTTRPQFQPEQLGVMMGADLLERFRLAGLEAAGQRRNVTVLFVDLSGYTSLSEQMDGEDLFYLIRQYINILIETVYKYEGTVDKITGDGLMALFGVPISHENNVERAVRSALEMMANVDHLSQQVDPDLGVELKIRVGLNMGTVIAGSIGSNMLMDYTAIGDTVNLAHRLEEAAEPGSILVSESVYRATRPLFDYNAVNQLVLKGISHPIQAYRLVALKAHPGSLRGLEGLRAPLVGRDQELQQLMNAVQALINLRQGQLVLVTGEAGIGKSRLTAELKAQIDLAPLRIIEGGSLAYRRSVSYWIFLELLRNYLKVDLTTPSAIVRERLCAKVNEVLGGQGVELLPYLEHLLSLEHADEATSERLAYLEAGQLRQQIFLAVRDLLVAEARRQPLVLVFEDLHWADESSLDLLDFLVDTVRQAPLMIYAISRPFIEGPLDKIVLKAQKWLTHCFTFIQLESLSPDQSERLFSELLAIPELPDELRTHIVQRAAGIPFYLEEILRMLIEGQVIRFEAGHWRLVPGADTAAQGVPDTLKGLILTRFDRLELTTRKTLQAASVIGRQFNLALLRSVIPSLDEDDLRLALANLVNRAFILQQKGSQDSEYLFQHVLTSDAVYSTLLRRDRQDLHGRVALAIEQLYAGRVDSQVEVLAGHFLHSPMLDRALHYLILAGQKAARDYANEQARRHYQDALTLLPRVSHTAAQAVQVYTGLGSVLDFTGEYGAARQQYQAAFQAIASADLSHYGEERSTLLLKIGATFERQGDFEQALLYYDQANEALEYSPEPAPVEKAMIFNSIGWIHFLRGNFAEAQQHLAGALSIVEASRQYDVIASIYNRLGAVAYHQREYEAAAVHARKSLALRETIGDTAGVARLYNNLGLLGLMRGKLREAEADFVQSIELLERIGDAEGIALAYTNLGLVQLERGDFESAEVNLKKSLAAAEQIGHRFYRSRALMYLGRLRTSQGQYAQSDQLLRECLNVLTELGVHDDRSDAAIYLGENCFASGDLEQALAWVKQVCVSIDCGQGEETAFSIQRGRVLRLKAGIARLKGELEAANDLLMESARIFSASYERLESARTSFELGLLARARNRPLEARQHFQEARLVFRQLGASFDSQQTETALHQLAV